MTTIRGVVGVFAVVFVVVFALSLSLSSSSLSSSSSWMISPNFRSGEMRLCDDVRDDEEEENKSTSF